MYGIQNSRYCLVLFLTVDTHYKSCVVSRVSSFSKVLDQQNAIIIAHSAFDR